MKATINKNFGLQSDSIKFGSTYYTVEVKNTEWVEIFEINCNSNEEFKKELNNLTFGRVVKYRIVEKNEPKRALKNRFKLSVKVEATLRGTRFIQATNYEHAKQIQKQYE